MKAHPHAELIRQFAEDAQVSETPWNWWEYRSAGEDWLAMHAPPQWDPDTQYRHRPAPAETEPLIYGTDYFVPCPSAEGWWHAYTWGRTLEDEMHLSRGLVYLNEQDAIARAKEWVS